MTLTIRDLQVAYDDVPAVRGVSLTVPDGQVLAVLGPSGCGKSTLLRGVAGLEQASGEVAWDGEDVSRLPTHRRGFALMFQDGQLFDHLTVARNVGYALRLRRRGGAGRGGRAGERRRVEELLALVGLEGYADRLPRPLSGGERQRVALARSLAHEPRLLLLDEPLSALDAGLRRRLALELRQILADSGSTAVMVTHDHEEAFTVADRLAVMRDGLLVQEGPIDEVWRAPVDAETALFLGYARVLRGSAATTVLEAAESTDRAADGTSAVAVRRSALRVEDTGALTGRVRSLRSTPEQQRLEVEVAGVGVVDAVASLDRRTAPGEDVALAVDVTRLAVLRER
ncbi:ABC transporter ATP-binding protein [uncultured Nocardioides sp.]|uniref:ABC transporter ATP-binding protein n=1 Tax=uncultured Nocardioides sp. TaxID=198441 RepID=UPI0026045B8D|nr:ABC transporter ATP-binding protein [uncultured Nocardioides sp.]